MVNFVILLLHFAFLIFVFAKKKSAESLTDALINVGLIIVLFTVGWSLISLVLNNLIEPQGFGKNFDRSAISLTILTIGELFFYKSFYSDLFTGKQEQVTSNDKEK